MLGCAGNVIDFAEEKEEEAKPVLSQEDELAAAKAKLALTDPTAEVVEEVEPPCCEQYGGLCEWIPGDFQVRSVSQILCIPTIKLHPFRYCLSL